MEITAPIIEYGLLMPVLLIFGRCLPRRAGRGVPATSQRTPSSSSSPSRPLRPRLVQHVLNWRTQDEAITAVGSLAIDGPTYFIWTILLIFGAASFLLFAERKAENGASVFAAQAAAVPGTLAEREAVAARVEHTEVYPAGPVRPVRDDAVPGLERPDHHVRRAGDLVAAALPAVRAGPAPAAAVAGVVAEVLPAGRDVLGVLPLRRRPALRVRRIVRLSSASTSQLRTSPQSSRLLLAGMALIGIGLLFKFGAVPFHSWTPDVYAGAPTAVTAFMAACTKIAAIGALMRVFYVALGADRWDWQPMMAIVAVATMAVGSVLAINQTDVKRMLAYSSIAHAGFIMTAFVGASQATTGQLGRLLDQRLLGHVLPGCVRGRDARRLRAVHRGPRSQRRGDPAAELGRPRSQVPCGRGGLLALHAQLCRHSADQRIHRQVGRFRGSLDRVARSLARGRGRGDQRDRRVLLHPGDRADVLLRSGCRRAADPPSRLDDAGRVGVGVVATVAFGVFPGPLLDLAQRAGEMLR